MNTSGDPIEPRFRFGHTAYIGSDGILYFAVFGGDSVKGKLNDLAM